MTDLCGSCCDGYNYCGKVATPGFPENTTMSCYKVKLNFMDKHALKMTEMHVEHRK